MLKRSIFIALACAVLAACAMGQVKPEQKAGIKKIGVYSALGATMNYDYIGTTIFTNKVGSAKNDWHLDDHVKQTMVSAL